MKLPSIPKLKIPNLPFGKNKKSRSDDVTDVEPDVSNSVKFNYETTFKTFDDAKKISPKLESKPITDDERKKRERLNSKISDTANVENITKQRGSFGLEIPDTEVERESAEELSKTISISNTPTYVEELAISQEIDRIERLIYDVRKDSSNIDPFINFAIESSGTESSITFMESLYHYTQSSGDSQVIVELAKMSGVELFAAVDEIINRKMKKIENLPLLLVASVIIPLFGILAAFGFSIFSEVFSNM